MTDRTSEHEITDEVIRAAQSNPNGWVYKIEGVFDLGEDVPPESIVGAWKVDENGNLTGEFITNPRYQLLTLKNK
ncbi:hypothetical protein [Ottowia testudinis]|uniref:Uncharacterized protein n=1 Tax=Ottowia testudinis TaxID=2816950 RepID=A0A975H3P5_9BURK|nr:hypothetical protein [Ottowia testudinis]QTD46039.1 hypothetical protein J1M35_03770 [Ottowia testudinis]